MAQTEAVKAIWLDDMINELGSFISKLRAFGVHTTTTEESPVSYGVDKVSAFDNVITDNKFSSDDWHEGSDFAKQLLGQHGKRVIVFSGFLDTQAKNKKMQINQETESAILYMPKIPGLENPVDEFVEEASSFMFDFFQSDFGDLESLKVPNLESEYSNVRQLGYRDFLSLSLKDKRAVYEEFVQGLETKPDEYFSDGAIWVFFTANSPEPFKVAYKKDEILYPEQIDAICDDLDSPSFIFRNDIKVNSTGCATEPLNRVTGDHLSTYPVAGIQFASGQDQPVDFREMHFDTGADFSFVSENFVSSNNIQGTFVTHLGELMLHGTKHLSDQYDFQVMLRGTVNSNTGMLGKIPHQMSCVVTENWEKGGLSISCSDACSNQDGGKLCKHRCNGLLGRTSYVCATNPDSIRHDVLITGEDSRVYFEPR